MVAGVKPDKRTHHKDIAVREIDKPKNAINESIPYRDKRIHGSYGKAIDELL